MEVSFSWQHCRECSQHAHRRISFPLSYSQQYDLSLHHAESYTFFKKEATAHCVWHCHFYPNRHNCCKNDRCFMFRGCIRHQVERVVSTWQIPQYFSMLNIFFDLFIRILSMWSSIVILLLSLPMLTCVAKFSCYVDKNQAVHPICRCSWTTLFIFNIRKLWSIS